MTPLSQLFRTSSPSLSLSFHGPSTTCPMVASAGNDLISPASLVVSPFATFEQTTTTTQPPEESTGHKKSSSGCSFVSLNKMNDGGEEGDAEEWTI